MLRLAVAALLLLCGAVPLTGQACLGDRQLSLGAFTAATRYAAAGGADGTTLGVELGVPAGPLRLVVTLGAVSFDDRRAEPVVGRVEAALPAIGIGGALICGSVVSGVARVSADGESATTLAAGPAVTLSRAASLGGVKLLPFIQLRGLAGLVTGDVLGEDLSGSQLALGVEWGVQAGVGRLTARGSVALDGFGAGLGIAPLPARAFRLSAVYGF